MHCSVRQLNLGEALYKMNDKSRFFYFLLRGQIHITVLESERAKFSNSLEENNFLGFREGNSERNDFATSKT